MTGKSVSSVKKWRIKVEKVSGYRFKKIKARVSPRSVQVFFDFTQEEVDKFVKLSKEIDKTKNLEKAVQVVWGDLEARKAKDMEELLDWVVEDQEELSQKLISLVEKTTKLSQELSVVYSQIKSIRAKLDELEEKQNSGLFSKIRKR